MLTGARAAMSLYRLKWFRDELCTPGCHLLTAELTDTDKLTAEPDETPAKGQRDRARHARTQRGR